MKKKEAVIAKSTKATNKPLRPVNKQRGIGALELLFAATTLGSTVLVAAMNFTKKPPLEGD